MTDLDLILYFSLQGPRC